MTKELNDIVGVIDISEKLKIITNLRWSVKATGTILRKSYKVWLI